MNANQLEAWDTFYNAESDDFWERRKEGQQFPFEAFQMYMRDYLQSIMAIDDSVGKLLDFLDKSQVVDNTLVVYTSDQGVFLGEHGFMDKRFMYEQSLKTPLLLRYPKLVENAGLVVNNMVVNIDLAPTFLDAAGILPPKAIQGRSIIPLIENKQEKSESEGFEWRKSMLYHYYGFPDSRKYGSLFLFLFLLYFIVSRRPLMFKKNNAIRLGSSAVWSAYREI